MASEEQARRAAAVRALLSDRHVQDALASIEADLVAEWRRARTLEERENLWRALNVMERLKAWLHSAASHDLAALRRAK